MDFTTLIVGSVLGVGLMLAYFVVFVKLMPGQSYIQHPAWLGTPTPIIKMLIGFQVMAAVGFIAAIVSWIACPPIGGIASNGRLPWIVVLFVTSAIIWPIALYYKVNWLVILSLISTAIGSILLLIGAVCEDSPRWWVVIGFLMLNIVTVLADGVMWNALFIHSLSHPLSRSNR